MSFLDEFLFTFGVFALGALVLVIVVRGRSAREVMLLGLGFLAHFSAVFAQEWITREVYHGGDVDVYFRDGIQLAHALRVDFANIAPEMLALFVHSENSQLPFDVFGGPSSTGSQTVITGALCFLLGDSRTAVALLVSLWAFFGKVAIGDALRDGLPSEVAHRIVAAVVLTPSVVFWSGTLAKEAVIIGFLGIITLLTRRAIKGEWSVLRVATAGTLLLPVLMIKPYVLLPFFVAAGVWLFWEQSERRGRSIGGKSVYFLVGMGLAVGGVVALGWLYPQFSLDSIARTTTDIQIAGEGAEGGSGYTLRDSALESPSLWRQIAVVPLALPTALFRPAIFEARSATMVLNSVETTLLFVLCLRVWLRRGIIRAWRTVFQSPNLLFCFTFTVLLGAAVGLASTNLGTLSRYRMPFMPFFVALVLVLDQTTTRDRLRDVSSIAQGLAT